MIEFSATGMAMVRFKNRASGTVIVNAQLDTVLAYLKVSETLEEFCALVVSEGRRHTLYSEASLTVAEMRRLEQVVEKAKRERRLRGLKAKAKGAE